MQSLYFFSSFFTFSLGTKRWRPFLEHNIEKLPQSKQVYRIRCPCFSQHSHVMTYSLFIYLDDLLKGLFQTVQGNKFWSFSQQLLFTYCPFCPVFFQGFHCSVHQKWLLCEPLPIPAAWWEPAQFNHGKRQVVLLYSGCSCHYSSAVKDPLTAGSLIQ